MNAKPLKKQAEKPQNYEKKLIILADFEQFYLLNGERLTVIGKKGDAFSVPVSWQRDGEFFILPSEARVRLPVKDE